MEFGFAITLGLLGSLHCAAMCGPLMLAVPGAGGQGRFIAGRILYQLGRITTYAALGVLAGLVGKSILLAGLQRWLSIALGVSILLGFLFSKKIVLSATAVRLVNHLKSAMSLQFQHCGLRSLILLGILNGLLPCGLVYVALAGAVAQASIPAGIAFMTLFGLGTLPTTLAISLSGKIFPLAWRLKLRGAIPFAICTLAMLLILRGMALGIPYLSPDIANGTACCQH